MKSEEKNISSQPGIYVHIPFCERKCGYCDFYSVTALSRKTPFVQMLIKEMTLTAESMASEEIFDTIYFGGGTPSLLTPRELEILLQTLQSRFKLAPDCEITLEANPGTVDLEKFSGFYQSGINRLSMGIQSFDDEKLKALGRIHSADEACLAIEAAKGAGFTNFNLDLMFALPNQTVEQALADVEQALYFSPPHLSHYQLTLEPSTPFYKNPPPLPEEDLAWEMQLACQARIKNAHYDHYEVSGFAQKNRQCKHNVNYWQYGDYIGLGAGAHGKITVPPEGKIWRTQMPASPGGYIEEMKRPQPGRQILVSEHDACFEFMLNALRLQEGFDLSLFEQRTGLPRSAIEGGVKIMQEKGWRMVSEPNYLKLTTKGRHYLNDVVSLFL